MRELTIAAFAALMSASACAPGLTESSEDLEPIDGGAVTTTRGEDGVYTTLVSAIDSEVWIHFSFDTGMEAFVVDSETSTGWDLRFSRFDIRVNGGESGPGMVQVTMEEQREFDEITQAPAGTYFSDDPDADGDGDPELAFRRPNSSSENGWFQYEPRFHTLTPADVTYVIAAQNGTYYKLGLVGYYDEHGEAGFPRFQWAAIGAP